MSRKQWHGLLLQESTFFKFSQCYRLKLIITFFNNSGGNAKRNYDGSPKFISEPDTIYYTMENSLLKVVGQEFSNLI